jgi:hypothetical protein
MLKNKQVSNENTEGNFQYSISVRMTFSKEARRFG